MGNKKIDNFSFKIPKIYFGLKENKGVGVASLKIFEYNKKIKE